MVFPEDVYNTSGPWRPNYLLPVLIAREIQKNYNKQYQNA